MLSRIDRAVADNIKDIQRSFGKQAGIVQDFIVFISRRLKTDLFGYTRFTVQEFCKYTGRSRQELALIHPDFASGKCQPPVIQGYAFQTVLDYALYSMMERNIIFSSRYEVKEKDAVIHMHNFPILKDLKLNFSRNSNDPKVYEIKVSDELIHGFLSRYYTLNAESYKLVGKGRGGDSRKKLLLYLSKLSHVVQSSGMNETTVPLNRLCEFADIKDQRPSHKKQNLNRMLLYIKDTGQFMLDWQYLSRPAYLVRLIFTPMVSGRILQAEHSFYYRLIGGLRSVYDSLAKCSNTEGAVDPFQDWVADRSLNLELKAQVLAKAYYISYNLDISAAHAVSLIRSGELLKPIADIRK